MIQTRITKMLSAALQTDTAPLATHYGAIVGIGELGHEVCSVCYWLLRYTCTLQTDAML